MNAQGPSLGERVRRYRIALGYSLSDLARQSGVSRSYLYQVESGESSPTEEKLLALANALGISVAELLGQDVPLEALDIPSSLKVFAEQYNLPPEDVRMLARINYRGRRPNSIEGWRLLYMAIQTTAEAGGV